MHRFKKRKDWKFGSWALISRSNKEIATETQEITMEEVIDLRQGISEIENESTIEFINKVKKLILLKTYQI